MQKPYLDPRLLPYPPPTLRLALVSAQMLIYHERFDPTAEQLVFYRAAVAARADDLEPAYRKKVLEEFVAAAKAVQGAEPAVAGAKRPRAAAGVDTEAFGQQGKRCLHEAHADDHRGSEVGSRSAAKDDLIEMVCSACRGAVLIVIVSNPCVRRGLQAEDVISLLTRGSAAGNGGPAGCCASWGGR
jgi:hypothetical protein